MKRQKVHKGRRSGERKESLWLSFSHLWAIIQMLQATGPGIGMRKSDLGRQLLEGSRFYRAERYR